MSTVEERVSKIVVEQLGHQRSIFCRWSRGRFTRYRWAGNGAWRRIRVWDSWWWSREDHHR